MARDIFDVTDVVQDRVETVSNIITLHGRTKQINALTSDNVWQIRRVSIQGDETVTEYADSGNYTQIWDNRTNLFNPIPFFNTDSTSFDGINDYIDVNDASNISFENNIPFTYSTWFKTTAAGTTHFISKQAGGGGANSGYRISINDGAIEVELRNAGNNRILVTDNIGGFNDNQWHNVQVTYDGLLLASGVNIYVDDGISNNTINNDTLTLSIVNSLDLAIGSNSGGLSGNYAGNLDEGCFFDKVLNSIERTETFNFGQPGDLAIHSASTNIISWWRMGDNATFPIIMDEVGENDGFMTNMLTINIVSDVP